MVRISNIEESLDFYCNKLGLKEIRRKESDKGRYTLIFLGAENSDERHSLLELTYNWDPEDYGGGRNFGHLAYSVDNIYKTCEELMKKGEGTGQACFVDGPFDSRNGNRDHLLYGYLRRVIIVFLARVGLI